MRLKQRTNEDNSNNIFWVTMTDLMTALVLVFIVLFFYMYMTSFYEKLQRWPENREERAAIRGRYARAADLALRFLWETGEEPATIACAALRTASVRRGLS